MRRSSSEAQLRGPNPKRVKPNLCEEDGGFLTRAEVSRHSTPEDLWVIIHNRVYDLTSFLKRHPGGTAPLRYAGLDASGVFDRVHQRGTLARMGSKFLVGELVERDRSDGNADADGQERGTSSSYYNVDEDMDGYDARRGGEAGREFGDHMAEEGETCHIPTIILIMYAAIAAWSWLTAYLTSCSVWTIPAFYVAGMIAFYNWHRMAHSEWAHGVAKKYGGAFGRYFAEMHVIHMEHHLERFPPSDFYGSAALYAKMYPDGRPTIWTLLDLTKTTSLGDGTALQSDMASERRQQTKAKGGANVAGDAAHSPLAHEWPLLAEMLVILGVGYSPVLGYSAATMGMVAVLYFVMASVGNALHMSFHVRNFHLEKYEWYRELRSLHYIHHLGDMKSNLAMLNLGMDSLFHSISLGDFRHGAAVRNNARRERQQQAVGEGSSTTYGYYGDLVRGKGDDDFPEGIDVRGILTSARHAGAVASVLGLDVPLDLKDTLAAKRRHERKAAFKYPAVLLRVALTAGAAHCWFALGSSVFKTRVADVQPSFSEWRDPGHEALSGLRQWLVDSQWAPTLCATSAITEEALAVVFMGVSVLGTSFRPMLSVILVYLVRSVLILAGSTAVVGAPRGAAEWPLPEGVPSLFVKRGPSLFFSLRVALAAVAAFELLSITVYAQYGVRSAAVKRLAAAAAACLVSFNVGLSVALQASWTFDVVIALLVARYCTIAGDRLAPYVDAFMP